MFLRKKKIDPKRVLQQWRCRLGVKINIYESVGTRRVIQLDRIVYILHVWFFGASLVVETS